MPDDGITALTALDPVDYAVISQSLTAAAREMGAIHLFTGVENAPATWAIGRLRTSALANCEWRWGNIWRTELRDYDVVYAFLSPAPMRALWEKVQQEMPPGTLFISNSFAVPGIAAEQIIEVDDARQTRLYCYRR